MTPARAIATDAIIKIQGSGIPGDAVTLSNSALAFGASLADPVNDPWPSSNSAIVSNDMDGDSKPGVTIPHLNDGDHKYLPVDPLRLSRADRGYYAARVVLSASGSVESCTEIKGKALVPRFDTHILGCKVANGGDCDPIQRDLLDSFRPLHKVDSAIFRAIKVADGSSCAGVRGALQ
jgi:hypothetical protein